MRRTHLQDRKWKLKLVKVISGESAKGGLLATPAGLRCAAQAFFDARSLRNIIAGLQMRGAFQPNGADSAANAK
jgi:hypothetical protein